MSKLVLTLPALYKDNSMQKEQLSKRRIKAKYQKLSQDLSVVERSRKNISFLVRTEDCKQRLIDNIREDIVFRTIQIEKMDVAAAIIQRKAKELNMRRSSREIKLKEIESGLNKDLKTLGESAQFIFWNLGTAATDASNKIKQAYKRSKFREKIDRIRKIFKILTKNKKTLCRLIVRKALRGFACKNKAESALIQRNNRVRGEKLSKIREKLAFLSIRSFWRLNKITYRKYMFKCRRYKTMLSKQRFGRFLSVDHVQSEISSYISTPRNEEVIPEVKETHEIANLAALSLFKERQIRLEGSLIAYNVRKPREKLINPLPLTSLDPKRDLSVRRFFPNTKPPAGYSSKSINLPIPYIASSNRSIESLSARSSSKKANFFRY